MVVQQNRWLSIQMVVLAVAMLAALLVAGGAGYQLRGANQTVPTEGRSTTISCPAGHAAVSYRPGSWSCVPYSTVTPAAPRINQKSKPGYF